jgi:predicted DNA-binding transcriptional regulator YafY
MDKFDRIFQLHSILSSRRTPIPLEDLMARLECSKSTLHRAIATLKDRLNAPVVFDTNAGGYKYGEPTIPAPLVLPEAARTPPGTAWFHCCSLAVERRILLP